METNNPTPEDYAIDPHEALDINAKATQGSWFYGNCLKHESEEENPACFRLRTGGGASVMLQNKENLAAIAYNHNNTAGLARRLIEAEAAVLDFAISWNSPGWVSAHIENPTGMLLQLAERIKAGREAQA